MPPTKTKMKTRTKTRRTLAPAVLPRMAKKLVRKRTARHLPARPLPVVISEPATIAESEKIFGVDAKRSREIRRLVDRVVA